MADVFISYTRADLAKASLVAAGFVAEGYSVFFDQNLVPGDSWDGRIERELAAAKAVVVLWSPASRDRQWVRNEARDGMQRGILCPAMIEACAIPIEFSHVQAADLTSFTGAISDKGWIALSGAVRGKVRGGNAPASAPLGSAQANATGLPPYLNLQLEEALREAIAAQKRFDLKLLHPQVRVAAEEARREELRAITASFLAQHAAELAEAAAAQARAGAAGYVAETRTWGDPPRTGRFETQVSGGQRNGYGVMTMTAGRTVGDVYAGQYRENFRSGFGVYRFAENANNTTGNLRFEGEYANGLRHGRGVNLWRSGERYAGGFGDGAHSGFGVDFHASGQRNEGAYAAGWQNGPGVRWRADGTVAEQGIYQNDTLAAPLAP